MSEHETPFSFFFLMECLLFYELSFLYFPFYKFKPIGLEKIEFLRVCKPNGEVQNQVALLVTGVASKKPILSLLIGVSIYLLCIYSSMLIYLSLVSFLF